MKDEKELSKELIENLSKQLKEMNSRVNDLTANNQRLSAENEELREQLARLNQGEK